MTGIVCSMVGASFTVAATTRTSRTITASNQAKISTAQSKFGGASAFFDGVSDSLTINGIASLANSDFTIEMWARFSTLPWDITPGYIMLIAGPGDPYLLIWRSGSGSQVALQSSFGGYGTFTKTGVSLAVNTWYHIAYTRQSGVDKAFFNGTELTTIIDDYGFLPNSGKTGNPVTSTAMIGEFGDGRGSMHGYLDEYRISKIARYTGDYTPPTSAFTNDENTVFLMHANGNNNATSFIDDTGSNDTNRTPKTMTVNSSAQISTAQSKFGGASALFARSGANDWIKTPVQDDLVLENYTSWTVEFWFRFANAVSDNFPVSTDDDKFNLRMQSGGSNNFNMGSGGSAPSWSQSFSTGTWYHFAGVKDSGGTVTVYIDGTSKATGTVGSTVPTTRAFYFGDRFDTGYCMDGYLDEIRISKTARYTGNFTPSASAFTNDVNTLLLLHCDGTNGSTTFTDTNA
jgi:hypothetical protein